MTDVYNPWKYILMYLSLLHALMCYGHSEYITDIRITAL